MEYELIWEATKDLFLLIAICYLSKKYIDCLLLLSKYQDEKLDIIRLQTIQELNKQLEELRNKRG